jgi:hypothetical protein
MTKGMQTDRELATTKRVQLKKTLRTSFQDTLKMQLQLFSNNTVDTKKKHHSPQIDMIVGRIKLIHVAEVQEVTAPPCTILVSYD